jgi:cytochrome c oxidase subunit 3
MATKAQIQEEKVFQNSVAMTVTLIAFGMMFATLFLGYFLVRANTAVWPPVEIQNMPKLLPFLSTLVMGLSSLTYLKMEKSESQRSLYWILTFALSWLGKYVLKKKEELTVIKLMNVGKFWHFLGVIWLLIYLMMFVL